MLDAMAKIGRVKQRELVGAQRPERLAALDDRLDQIRRVPLGRDDVVALGLEPRLEQFPLGRLAGTVGPFEGDQESSAALLIAEMFSDELLQRSRSYIYIEK